MQFTCNLKCGGRKRYSCFAYVCVYVCVSHLCERAFMVVCYFEHTCSFKFWCLRVVYLCPKRATLRIHTISQSHDLSRSIRVNVLSVFLESCIDQYDFLLCPFGLKCRMWFVGVRVSFERGAASVECVLGQDYLITWTVWVFVMRQLFIAWRASQVQVIECNYARLILVM